MADHASLQRLHNFMMDEIPLLAHMQLRIEQPAADCLTITAPIGPNSNHHRTAFGGSIATLGIACGWAWTYLQLAHAEIDSKLVIRRNTVDYLAPVHDDFTARCSLQDADGLQRFIDQLRTERRARIHLSITTTCNEQPVAQHTAVYAATLGAY